MDCKHREQTVKGQMKSKRKWLRSERLPISLRHYLQYIIASNTPLQGVTHALNGVLHIPLAGYKYYIMLLYLLRS